MWNLGPRALKNCCCLMKVAKTVFLSLVWFLAHPMSGEISIYWKKVRNWLLIDLYLLIINSPLFVTQLLNSELETSKNTQIKVDSLSLNTCMSKNFEWPHSQMVFRSSCKFWIAIWIEILYCYRRRTLFLLLTKQRGRHRWYFQYVIFNF